MSLISVWQEGLANDWISALSAEFTSPHMVSLEHFLTEELEHHTVYPSQTDVFNALRQSPISEIRVVILGQAPYHGQEQAHGLSFSIRGSQPLPPSLKNIYRELADDIGIPVANEGDLSCWASQGVLLLNAVLTVREAAPGSHRGRGWERLTDAIIARINEQHAPIVFMLWGVHAQKKAAKIDRNRHCVLTAAHPSPLSAHRGFFGCRHFSLANAFLKSRGRAEIDWQVSNLVSRQVKT